MIVTTKDSAGSSCEPDGDDDLRELQVADALDQMRAKYLFGGLACLLCGRAIALADNDFLVSVAVIDGDAGVYPYAVCPGCLAAVGGSTEALMPTIDEKIEVIRQCGAALN